MVGERILYYLAKWLHRSEVCHSSEMKDALSSSAKYNTYRSSRVDAILAAAAQYDVAIEGRDLLDFGCADGVLSAALLEHGAKSVTGVDVDREAIAKAQALAIPDRLSFHHSTVDGVPLEDESIDVVISYDVFEHVAHPERITEELFRIVRPGGKVLIGTWGWHHPFAPHLFATMPVPWAHVFFSEKTVLRACRRVYHAPWYVPMMHDFDKNGQRMADKYGGDEIPSSYVNKLFIRDFERIFHASRFAANVNLVPFQSRRARWTRPLLRVPYLRELFTGYLWVILKKPGAAEPSVAADLAHATPRTLTPVAPTSR
jgi:2-polyprenyl-3-methyl-5-hydroxy-6-metoxy-1,4-benzoquinol methylase